MTKSTDPKTLVTRIFAASDLIKNGRSVMSIIEYGGTEYGELTEEGIIAQGRSYKSPGKDGIIGEALDVILCMVDVIRIEDPSLTEDDLIEIAIPKIQKWVKTTHRPAFYARRENGPHHDPEIGGTYMNYWVVRDKTGAVFAWDKYRNDLEGRFENLTFLSE